MRTLCGTILAAAMAVLVVNADAAGSPYGACAHITRDEPQARTCAMMRQAGMGWVRSDFDWHSIERKRGEWDFSRFDKVVSACEAEGMQLLPILGYSVPWANPAHEHLDAWEEYVRRVVGHYGRRLPVVEVWNEENLSGFWRSPNPTNYLALLRRTYETVKGVNPSVRVAFGGTAGVPLPFIEEVYKLGGAKYFDIMNIHPYSFSGGPEGSLDTNIEKLRAVMAKYGDAQKPLWITEIGWPTHSINIHGELMFAGLKAARPELDRWRMLYLHASDGDDSSYTDQLVLQQLQKTLPAGSKVEACCSAKTAERLARGDVDAVVYPFSELYPADSFGAVRSFVKNGGVLVEFGGMPMWVASSANKEGHMVVDKRHETLRDRQSLRLSEMAWWMDKRYPESLRVLPTAAAAGFNVPAKGFVGKRFLTPRLLKEGDSFIPLLSAKTNGVDAVAAAVYKFDSDMKGAVVVNTLMPASVFGANSEAQQADMTARALGIAFAEGVENFFLYEFRQVDRNPYDAESFFGIVHDNFAPKPAYGAYMTFVGARPTGSVQKGGVWRSEDGKVYYPQWTIPGKGDAGMIWTCGEAKDMAVTFSSDGMTFLDVAGARVRPARTGKVYTLPVSGSPIYFFGGELISFPSGIQSSSLQRSQIGYDTLIAHRGESHAAPENTLPAYKLAVERGFGFECDVYLSKDGRVFTLHDDNLKRTTAGASIRKCADVTWDEISRLDVGGWGKWKGSKFSPTRPALLEEVLELARDGRYIYIEVKPGPEIVPHIKKVFAAQRKATPGNVLFISSNKASCKALKKQMPEYRVFWITCSKRWGVEGHPPITTKNVLDALRETGADGVDCEFAPNVVTAEMIAEVRKAGYEFHVWTVDNLAATQEAFRRGVQTVTTNCAEAQMKAYAASKARTSH